MNQSRGWRLSRLLALCAVLALHLAVLAALMRGSRTELIALTANYPLQLVDVPAASFPKIRAENARPQRIKGDTAISVEPLLLGSIGSSQAPSASSSVGNGSGVDWKAEARRAVQAFEIRSHEPDVPMSRSPAEDWWWPRTRHNAGDHYKTESGDWIVWINSRCYQIAVAGSSPYAPGALLPQTLCPGAAHGEVVDEPGGARKDQSQD
ncbi:MAG: hypothetical protein WBF21_11715 [Steroidobacteraceae bacterium]